jgi:hypothetical protein
LPNPHDQQQDRSEVENRAWHEKPRLCQVLNVYPAEGSPTPRISDVTEPAANALAAL